MIIKFGAYKSDDYASWEKMKNVFISRPYFKIVFSNGLGFYVLNAVKFNLLPKFYGTFHKSFWEFGISFVGWIFEFMWNKAFVK
ncbi:hypothetical protein EB118_13535 [bacterium]|nr:hypothetical protein [bacterium]NDG31075.1 hypothetical protein [bacterium]